MRKILFFSLFIFLTIGIVEAQTIQTNSSGFDKSKLEFGGNLSFSFGKSQFSGNYKSLNINPQIGYLIHPKFSIGFGPSYIYRGYSKSDYSENYGGLTFYGRFRPINYLLVLAQPEFYRTWGKNFDNRFVPSLLLGAGGIIPVGTGGVSVTMSYDVIQNNYSPYGDQIVYSVGYVFRF